MADRDISWRFYALQTSWRRPKGIDSRCRRKFKGTTLMPNIGYGSAKKTKHMLPNGVHRHKPCRAESGAETALAEASAHAGTSNGLRVVLQLASERHRDVSQFRLSKAATTELAFPFLLSGFLKYIVHNVEDLNLLLMHNRCEFIANIQSGAHEFSLSHLSVWKHAAAHTLSTYV